MDFNLDGKAMLNSLFMMEAKKRKDKSTERLIETFQKYGLDLFEGMALLTEIVSITDGGRRR